MKTPDEIKKALECCFNASQCGDCPYYPVSCDRELVRDAREYIRQLEADNDRLTDEVCNAYNIQNEQLARIKQFEAERDGLSIMLTSATSAAETYKRERDAAVKDIEESQPCFACKHFNRNSGNCGGGKRCLRLAEIAERNVGTYRGKYFEWRGVQKEE